MKLVCLDDDRRMEPVLRRFAGRLGHQLRFHTASRAFKIEVTTQVPDLVVLDLVLGRESSMDIIDWLARTQLRVPVVLLSGHGDELLQTARRIAQASGLEVLGAISKVQMVRDLLPLLAEGGGAPWSETPAPADGPRLAPAQLERCIREGCVEPWFRSIVSPAGGRLRGAQVLARLRLPSGGLVDAPALLALAESAGLSLPLAEALLARLVALVGQLKPLGLDSIAFSLSAAALDRQSAIALVRMLVLVRTLIEGLTDRCCVRVELTEIGDRVGKHGLAARIDLLGASPDADDLGNGDSRIRALAGRLADQPHTDAFAVAESLHSRNLLLAMAILGRGLGLRVVAEGVDVDPGRRVPRGGGTDRFQSDLVGGPLDIQAFVRAWDEPATGAAAPSRGG